MLEEFGEQFVVVEVRFAELVIQRPGAGVVVGHERARLRVAGFEQRQPERVLCDGGVVVEADERLDEAVEDAVIGRVCVLRVDRAGGGRHAHPLRRRRLEDAERLLGGGEVGRFLEALIGAREHLQGRALGEAARPRRRAAVEVEQVLPGDPARALCRERDDFAHQLAQVGVFMTGEEEAVALAERGQPLDLDALSGVVLPDQLARRKANPVAAREQRFGRPPEAVAFEREEHCRQPRGDQLPGAGHLLHVAQHGAQLGAAGAADPPDGTFRGNVDAVVLAVGELGDRPVVQQALQGRGDGWSALGCG